MSAGTGAPFELNFAGPSPEGQVARDLVRRGLPFAPVLVVLGFLWGVDGALSAAFGVALVLANFLANAALLTAAARVSVTLLMAAALGGFFVRLGVIAVAVVLVIDQAWVEVVPLGLALVVAHVGLLFWETRYVSASLAFPGLKPPAEGRVTTP